MELIEIVTRILSSILLDKGLSEEEAADISEHFACRLGKECGGEYIYLPKDLQTWTRRNKEIAKTFYEESEDSIVKKLSKKYGLTTRRIYQILKSYEDKQNRNKNNDK